MDQMNDDRYRPTKIVKQPNGKYSIFYSYYGADDKLCRTSISGFKQMKEAVQWQHEELPYLIAKRENFYKSGPTLLMSDLIEEYMTYSRKRRKNSTNYTKELLISLKIMPFFGDMNLYKVTKNDIRKWQEFVLQLKKDDGSKYAPTSLQAMNNILSAIFNYAVQFHDLPSNPVKLIEQIGSRTSEYEKEYWTLEEYEKFSEAIQDKPEYYYAFEVMFWCGLRLGELLALTKEDLDLDADLLHVRSSYSPLNGDDMRTKTKNSVRTVHMPHDLSEELQDYMDTVYMPDENQPLFPTSKSSLHRAMTEGSKRAGVKRITIHGLRHSHISLLMNSVNCASAMDVAKRAGHKSPDITMIYTHQYANKDELIAAELNALMQETKQDDSVE